MTPQTQENNLEINHAVTVILLQKIIELLDKEESEPETLKADEVRAALRNELSAVVKSIKALPDNKDVIKQLKTLTDAINKIDFKPVINVAASEVKVPDINIPEISLPTITIPPFEIPTPQVNYTAPEINIPAPIVNVEAPILNVPEVDLDEVVKELNDGLRRIRQNALSNPLYVKISDINKIIDGLDGVKRATKEVMLGFPGSIRIQNATGGTVDFNSIGLSIPTVTGSGKKTVTTSGTRVSLASSISVKSVTIKALVSNTGTIYVGNTTVSSTNGFQLSANDSVSLEISDLSLINLDSSVSGEGVSYMWVN